MTDKCILKRPQIGMRTIKSAIGVFLGFMIYFLRGEHGIPLYTAMAVLWCMRPYKKDSLKMAGQRITGTLIGGVYGMFMILYEQYIYEPSQFVRYCAIALLIIPIIQTTIILNKKSESYFACVVFLSITVNHLTDANPYLFVMNRVLDTMIGIVLALVINMVELPKKYNKETLFVSGMDDTLLSMQHTISPYSQVHLNRMLDEGANFTIASMRTTATLVENLNGIRIFLPVIAMDGAVLFDMKRKKYICKVEMTEEDSKEIESVIKESDIHVFTNVLVDDSWFIYYDDFNHEVEKQIFERLRMSPYRNYLKCNLAPNQKVLYYMMIDETKKIDALYQKLCSKGFHNRCKIVTYPSTEYEGYSYMKIYDKEATRSNMIQKLSDLIGTKQIITFGSIDGKSDIIIKDSDNNELVKVLRKLFEKRKLIF